MAIDDDDDVDDNSVDDDDNDDDNSVDDDDNDDDCITNALMTGGDGCWEFDMMF
jgi:hypothetical protein